MEEKTSAGNMDNREEEANGGFFNDNVQLCSTQTQNRCGNTEKIHESHNLKKKKPFSCLSMLINPHVHLFFIFSLSSRIPFFVVYPKHIFYSM